MARTYISPLGVFFIMAGSLAYDPTVGICSNWKMDHDWQNYIDASDMLLEKSDSRLMECAMLCGRISICYSFFHHPTMRTCLVTQSYKRGLPFNRFPQLGWNYYTQPQLCNGDYEYNQTLGLCYKLYEDYTDYEGAMTTCEKDGAKLLIINTPAELQHFTMRIGDLKRAWIGLQGNRNTPSVFTWWNGQEASNITWYQGYPQDGFKSGVQLFNGTFLNTRIDDMTWASLCQKLM